MKELKEIEKNIQKKYRKEIFSKFVRAIKDFNLFDVVDYVTLGNFNTSLFYVTMNKNSWNKMSEEDQEIVEELKGIPMAKKSGNAFDQQKELAEKQAKEKLLICQNRANYKNNFCLCFY